METLWRWTSSVFLILALNIGRISNQNVGANGPLMPQVLQGVQPTNRNPGLVNSQLQTNNLFLYPPKGLVPEGPAAPILECQRSSFQDCLCTQDPLNQQANVVPISQSPCASLGPLNTAGQSSLCADVQGRQTYNIPSQSPFPLPILPQNQCSNGPQISPPVPLKKSMSPVLEILPQGQLLNFEQMVTPFAQSTLPGSSSIRSIPNVLPTLNSGLNVWPGQPQGLPSYQQAEPTLFSNSASMLRNNFSPLVPTVNPSLPAPCIDAFPPQENALSSLTPQSILPTFPPFSSVKSLNNQVAPVDVLPLEPAQCPLTISSASQITNFPQASVFAPLSDVLPETQPGVQFGSTFRNSLPFSSFRFPRPTIFPTMTPFQNSLTNTLPSSCDSNSVSPLTTTPNQGSISFYNPGLIQQDSLFPQIPTPSAIFMPNISPELPNQNVPPFPSQSSIISQQPLNSGLFDPFSLQTDLAPKNVLAPPNMLQTRAPNGLGDLQPQMANSVDFLPITAPFLKGTLLPMQPTPLDEANKCDNSNLCQSDVFDTVPVPINLQISIPPPIIPAPRITIINASPLPATSTTTQERNMFELPYPMPPMIIESRRSKSRSWLPLVLVALFAGDGNFGGFGGGCSCDSGPVPIPYPILIPTNNPVIVNQ